MKRTVESELLDGDCGTPAEIAAALADLRRVNRWFGGVTTSKRLLERVVNESALRRLSTGRWQRLRGRSTGARQAGSNGEVYGCIPPCWTGRNSFAAVPDAIVGDALDLPFPPESFDLVTCSLFVHHLEPTRSSVSSGRRCEWPASHWSSTTWCAAGFTWRW